MLKIKPSPKDNVRFCHIPEYTIFTWALEYLLQVTPNQVSAFEDGGLKEATRELSTPTRQ